MSTILEALKELRADEDVKLNESSERIRNMIDTELRYYGFYDPDYIEECGGDLDKMWDDYCNNNDLFNKDNAEAREMFNDLMSSHLNEDFDEDLTEDLSSFPSLPAELLPVATTRAFIEAIPAPTPQKPPYFFKLGYMKELDKEIASKFRGGRGSEGSPFVRIIKCTEYSKLYTGSSWLGTNATMKADKILGTERHTGEKTGFNFRGDTSIENKIGVYGNGREALQAYIVDGSIQKTKFFISIDGGELTPIDRSEVAQYLTGAHAAKVLGTASRAPAGVDANGNPVHDKPINRFYLDQIYMIGNNGHSII